MKTLSPSELASLQVKIHGHSHSIAHWLNHFNISLTDFHARYTQARSQDRDTTPAHILYAYNRKHERKQDKEDALPPRPPRNKRTSTHASHKPKPKRDLEQTELYTQLALIRSELQASKKAHRLIVDKYNHILATLATLQQADPEK